MDKVYNKLGRQDLILKQNILDLVKKNRKIWKEDLNDWTVILSNRYNESLFKFFNYEKLY